MYKCKVKQTSVFMLGLVLTLSCLMYVSMPTNSVVLSFVIVLICVVLFCINGAVVKLIFTSNVHFILQFYDGMLLYLHVSNMQI